MSIKTRLAIICTHPIQYYVPVFKQLAEVTELKVFYTAGKKISFDKGFRLNIQWDIPLLEGYDFQFLINNAKKHSTSRFFGTINPDATSIIRQFDPSHILIYGWAHYSHFKILNYFSGKVRILFRGDSTALRQQHPLKSLTKKIILKYIYSRVNHALYTGINNKYYFKNYGLKNNQLIFAPHAVDNGRFACTRATLQIREMLQIKNSEIVILFAGKFTAVKNPEMLLKAFAGLQLTNTHLLMVGDGPLAANLRSIYQHEKIHFLPFQNQSNMPAVYQSCDLFCMPSKSDSWGLAINEAMAAGKAILASDMVGCCADLVKPANGMIFQSNNISDLKQRLVKLTHSKAKLTQQGQSSKVIIQKWNFETQVKGILSALSI
ncbi:MAG TPA: glycosyltransferase family 4 protein [Pedobacter sp.]|uniref:glycosyltransferase family 4 protein n=1 Tax=Pedobacter sp. TaxID=1411316 RepID=UPI002BE8D7A5|nr:glycosyltransferase family 4 protein [Pedobacter sp.]HMI02659.1 glycosyltransferase family 4 protein [Pedobacter sp.]